MPARWSKPQCRYFFTLLAVVLFVPAGVVAQTGNNSVVIRTTVSKAVMLSVPPNTNRGDVDVEVMSSGGTVRLTLSGKDLLSLASIQIAVFGWRRFNRSSLGLGRSPISW